MLINKVVAVILYGLPGSGKGTQAGLLANKLGLVHIDTGRIIEEALYGGKSSSVILRERKIFESGKLSTTSWVLGIVGGKVKQLARAGVGMVLSGSPRTVMEAKTLMPIFRELYSRKKIFIFVLEVPASVSLRRNSKRLICAFCGAPLLAEYYAGKPKYCPVCGGKLYRRVLDKPKVIKERILEFKKRTEPIFSFLRKSGYKLKHVDGQPAPYKVIQKIMKAVG